MGMHTWFECRIRYEKVMENGMQKKVTEPYLVDALSFTEAEARIIEEMTPFISGEFTVSDIKRVNYSELFPSDDEADDIWFKCKLSFITLDEKSGAEKRTSTYVLVQASDLGRAKKNLDAGMKGTMAEYQVSSVTETAIMDVYPYTALVPPLASALVAQVYESKLPVSLIIHRKDHTGMIPVTAEYEDGYNDAFDQLVTDVARKLKSL